MRRLQFFVVFIIATLFCVEACAFTASYEQTMNGPGVMESQVRSVKIKDDKIRMEMDTPEGRGIVIMDGDTMLSYNPSQGVAFKMKTDMWRDMDVLSDYTSYLESLNARIVGSERVGPYDCDIYEYIDPRVNIESRVWLWKAKQFPVKVEMESPTGVITTTMENVKVGININDSEFTLPAGVKIVETPGRGYQD